MPIPYQVFVALRYLKSKKRHRGLSITTAISIGGVAVGVMALLVVLSVMSGFHQDLQEKILGVSAHVIVLDYKGNIEDYKGVMDKLKHEPHVVSQSPFVLGQVMVSVGERAQGVVMRGIEPSLEAETTEIKKHLKEGSFEELAKTDGMPGMLMGRELALRLGVVTGDTVRIISPIGKIGPLGMLPKVMDFRVAGIFEIGMFEYDSNLVLTGMKQAQDFLELGDAVTGIELKIDDIYKARDVSKAVGKTLGFPYYGRDWIQMNKNLFSALKLEKLVMFVILTLIVLVAAFNIVSTLTMNVIEKEREIAIMKAMGASRKGIMAIFMLQGFLIGLSGTIIGLAGGYAVGYLMNTYEIIKLPADVYYLSHLPARMKLSDFIAVSVSAVIISFLATVYPAWQAAKLNPIEPLRYE
ncbi:MAG: lipoprotein-releasing ABC transporter permease subunit [Thermodesulfovibrionales bacterium]|nr:lipoprotein-releasing ABC transporter permease subunit [Thermodesulfovibrionales bacterium]